MIFEESKYLKTTHVDNIIDSLLINMINMSVNRSYTKKKNYDNDF